jgi:hypothetical protein
MFTIDMGANKTRDEEGAVMAAGAYTVGLTVA